MKTRSLLLVAASVLACGCMAETKPRGNMFTYECSGSGTDWGACTQKANAQCGANNFDIVSQKGDAGSSGSGGSEMKRTLVVKCR